MSEYKHHERKDGLPNVQREDIFVLVLSPLQSPRYFLAFRERRVITTALRSLAKQMDWISVKCWQDFLDRMGHDFFIATGDELAKLTAKDRVLKSKSATGGEK